MVWAVKHYRHYIYGYHCTIITDHQPLKSLLNTPHPSGKLARWGLTLQEMDLEIVYRPGKRNAAADSLSRMPIENGLVPDIPIENGLVPDRNKYENTHTNDTVCVVGALSRRHPPGTGLAPCRTPERPVEVTDPALEGVCEGQAPSGINKTEAAVRRRNQSNH